MKFHLENIQTRKVLVEKFVDPTKRDLYGLKFCSYKSNKESLLIVEFHNLTNESLIRYNRKLSKDVYGNLSEDFEPIKIRIVESIDNNSSVEFYKWINKSIQAEKSIYGIDMFFFNLNPQKYSPVLSLRGCSLDSLCIIEGKPIVSVNFFAYLFPKENS